MGIFKRPRINFPLTSLDVHGINTFIENMMFKVFGNIDFGDLSSSTQGRIVKSEERLTVAEQTIGDNTASIELLDGAIINKVENSVFQSYQTQTAGEISSKVSSDTFNTYVTQTATEISQKASASAVDTLSGRVTNAETSITQNANAIALKASQSSVDDLGNRVTTAETSITQNAQQIQLKASQSGLDTTNTNLSNLTTRVTNAETSITQNATAITLKASQTTVDTLTGRVSTAESNITQNATDINLKVSKDGVVSAINQSAESIKISAGKVDVSGLVTFTDLSTAGKTTINGANITTGSMSFTNLSDKPFIPSTAADVGARPNTWMPTASDVGARPSGWMPTASEVGAKPAGWLPTWSEVSSKPFIPATAADVGALATNWVGTTYIDGSGMYTGTIAANKILAGTVSGVNLSGQSLECKGSMTFTAFIDGQPSQLFFKNSASGNAGSFYFINDQFFLDKPVSIVGGKSLAVTGGISTDNGSNGYSPITCGRVNCTSLYINGAAVSASGAVAVFG